MKRSPFLALFIAANVGFVLLHLHKQSQFIQLSYTKQKVETEMGTLQKQKQELTHQLYTLYDRTRVLNYAKKELNMTQARVGQFKKINNTVATIQPLSPTPLELEVMNDGIEVITIPENKNVLISHGESILNDSCT